MEKVYLTCKTKKINDPLKNTTKVIKNEPESKGKISR